MEVRRTWTKEEHQARDSYRTDMARITRMLLQLEEDPHMNDDLPPHLVGRN